jgi:uncharacterized membrane protein YtjA (UPF0391 family)
MLPPGTGFSKANCCKLFDAKATPRPDLSAVAKTWNQRPRSPLAQCLEDVAVVCREGWRSYAMTLLKWALIFFLVSVVAGVFGFTGISAASADVARFLFYVFVVIFLVLLVLGLTIFRV